MIDAIIREPMPGHRSLWIIEQVDADGEPTVGREISLAAIAGYRELLGIDDPVECLEALIYLQDHPEPDPDPVTGKHCYTEAIQLLRVREQARGDAALEVKEHKGHTDHQVQVASAQMAYRAVHEPINGGECAMDRCRREARQLLGIPDPARKCGVETRTEAPPVPARISAQARAMRPAGGKAKALEALAGQADYLLECAQTVLHGLSGHDTDPLEVESGPAPEPDPDAVILTADELLAKYQGGHP